MSVLYNFVKVDIDAFLSNPKHLEILVSMCKSVRALYKYNVTTYTVCKNLRVVLTFIIISVAHSRQ